MPGSGATRGTGSRCCSEQRRRRERESKSALKDGRRRRNRSCEEEKMNVVGGRKEGGEGLFKPECNLERAKTFLDQCQMSRREGGARVGWNE